MKIKMEQSLVRQCAPTLAGLKVGSLFHHTMELGEKLDETVQEWNHNLMEKGVCINCMKRTLDGGLLYVFRPAMLWTLLQQQEVKRFLNANGYLGCSVLEDYIGQLRNRLENSSDFPHEIGIFLGYPLCDVQGFIENQGMNFSMCGLWKVYGEQQYAEKLFLQYKKCKTIYCEMLKKGRSILQLTVAA